jgi:hypothetical protein
MKRIIIALTLAAATAALAQSISSTSGSVEAVPVSSADGGSFLGGSSADGGASTVNSTSARPVGTPASVYSFDPPPIGQYSFSITSR